MTRKSIPHNFLNLQMKGLCDLYRVDFEIFGYYKTRENEPDMDCAQYWSKSN